MVFKGEATFREARILKNMLLQAVTNSTKVNKGFPCINIQP
jgi:hypothetical protein